MVPLPSEEQVTATTYGSPFLKGRGNPNNLVPLSSREEVRKSILGSPFLVREGVRGLGCMHTSSLPILKIPDQRVSFCPLYLSKYRVRERFNRSNPESNELPGKSARTKFLMPLNKGGPANFEAKNVTYSATSALCVILERSEESRCPPPGLSLTGRGRRSSASVG